MDITAALSEHGIRLRDYGVGEHKVTCPRCSAQRKKKHEPCLNVRLGEDGGAVWQCWHCGWTGRTGTNGAANGYEPAARSFRRPEPPRTMDTGDRLFEWFAGRGISREIVEALEIHGTTKGRYWLIVFPYRHRGELVNNKYRSLDKKFHQDKDAARTFFNIDAVGSAETVIIAEGEVDVLSLLEAGYEAVISLVDGAPPKPDMKGDRRYEPLRTCEAELAHATKFILAKDAEAPGG